MSQDATNARDEIGSGALGSDADEQRDVSAAFDADLDTDLGFGSVVSVTGREADDTDDDTDDDTVTDHAAGATGATSSRRSLLRRRRSDRRPGGAAAARPKARRSRVARKLTAAGIMFGALFSVGGVYAIFATSSGAASSTDTTAAISEGRQLYAVTCIACHGKNLQGVNGRGPSLIGVGSAATYFQVATGRMPAPGQGAEINRKTPKYNDEQTRALAAFVQSVGGGTPIPTGQLRGGSTTIADGGELFSVNCASCHGMTEKGAPLSAGKVAPSLNKATDLEIWTAMLSGPESMPVFNNNQLTPDEKRAIVAYVQTIKSSADPGGSGIDRIGPVSEAIVIWVAGVGFLMVAILWIGARSR